jgi:uncharacterized protein YrrD
MIIELSQILGTDVHDSTGAKVATVSRAIFNGRKATLAGLQVVLPNIVKKTSVVYFEDILSLDRKSVVVDSKTSLKTDMKDGNELLKIFGSVVGVNAKTESGRPLGKVHDLYLDSESGLIVRIYIRQLLKERIIPREFLVSISPKEVIFKDIVDQPIFDKVATSSAATAA